jgi:hypothetical protein
VIDHSDAVGFPVPGTEHYDQTRRRCAGQHWRCVHMRTERDQCVKCELARGEADEAYRAAIGPLEKARSVRRDSDSLEGAA